MYYIYCLKCPLSNKIRYIGQTRVSLSKRLGGHLYDSRKRKKEKYNHKDNWIFKLSELNLKPIIEEIESFKMTTDLSFVLERETYWILKLKSENIDLLNSTDGGEYSINNNKPFINNMKGYENPMFGKKHTEVTKKAMSDKKVGIYEGKNNPRSKPIYQYDKNLNLVKKWDYAKECCDYLNISRGNVSTSAKYNSKITKNYMIRHGFIFSFDELL